MKFAVIDDSQDIFDAVSLCVNLRWPQAEIVGANTGDQGLKTIEEQTPDLVILDVGLPDMSGLEVLQWIRKFSDVPVIILTARDQDVEIARFLEAGADDYIVKPFSHVELLGRIQAILRRTRGRVQAGTPVLQAGDLLMDFDGAEVHRSGVPVSLTRTELNLLADLVRNATRVVTYESLASKVLNSADLSDSDTRLIKVHIQHLRAKLNDSAENPRYITNIYGIGYKFMLPVTAGVAASKAAE